MFLSSTSWLAAFLGSFQRHGITTNQGKLEQRVCLSFLFFFLDISVPISLLSHSHCPHLLETLMSTVVGFFCPTSLTF